MDFLQWKSSANNINEKTRLSNPKETVENFLDLIKTVWQQGQDNDDDDDSATNDIKVIVLWRRRFFDRFVSLFKAMAKKSFHSFRSSSGKNDTKKDKGNDDIKIQIKKDEYVGRFEDWFGFNQGLRNTLMKMKGDGILEYEVLQYEDDLLDRSKQMETAKRMVDFLGIAREKVSGLVDGSLLDTIPLMKLSQTRTEDQITNWEEVSKWGYGTEAYVGDWHDVFAPDSSFLKVLNIPPAYQMAEVQR